MVSLVTLILQLSVLYGVLLAFTRYWRLKHIRGPVLASLTDFWRARKQRTGPTKPWLQALHQKYGPLVRIGPNTISVADAGSMRTIFTSKGEFSKADSYGGMRLYVKGKMYGSMIDIQDEDKFRAIKRAVGAAWITSNLLDYEPDVDSTLVDLKRRLRDQPTCNLYATLRLFQMDFLMKATFSEDVGNLEKGGDEDELTRAGSERGRHWVVWQPLPRLERFIFHSPIWARFIKRDLSWLTFANAMVAKRRSDASGERKVDLLQRFLDASEKHPDAVAPDTVASLVWSVLSAGKDTTVATSSAMVSLLLRHPATMQRLMAELNDAKARGKLSDPPKYTEVNTLPYLDAVFKEVVRLNPFPPILMERVVPVQGAVLAGQAIPGGTIVGSLASLVHLDKSCFGEDAEDFRPERWLTKDDEERRRMERGFIGFGAGSRICLGRHIAELEVKKVVPTLLMCFDIQLASLGAKSPTRPLGNAFTMLTVTCTPK